jgi:opacity protein-like surface antigen
MKKILAALLLTLPTLAVAVDLDGYYITPKVGVSKTMDTGVANLNNSGGVRATLKDEDLGTGTAFGLSVGKYITDNFRLELEAIKRDSYEYNSTDRSVGVNIGIKGDIDSTSLFINGLYDFQPFSLGNTPITPYLGGGIGVSRNKMGSQTDNTLPATIYTFDGKTITEFAYKLSAGTLFSLTENISLDVNYQYVNLGAFKGSTAIYRNGVRRADIDLVKALNGGEIKTQELMVGLQYTFK